MVAGRLPTTVSWELPFCPSSPVAVGICRAKERRCERQHFCRGCMGWGVWPEPHKHVQPCFWLPSRQVNTEGPWKTACPTEFFKRTVEFWECKGQWRKSSYFSLKIEKKKFFSRSQRWIFCREELCQSSDRCIFLFYQIFGLESEVLRNCNSLHVFRRLVEMLFTNSCQEHVWKMQYILHYCYIHGNCLSFPRCPMCRLAVEQFLKVLWRSRTWFTGKTNCFERAQQRQRKQTANSQMLKEPAILFAMELIFHRGENEM